MKIIQGMIIIILIKQTVKPIQITKYYFTLNLTTFGIFKKQREYSIRFKMRILPAIINFIYSYRHFTLRLPATEQHNN